MKIFFLITIILFISCKDTAIKVDSPKGWTEEQKRKYFEDFFSGRLGFGQFGEEDSTKTFAYFFKTQYPDIKTKIPFDAFPYAFEEKYIDTTKIDSSSHWFRLMVKPCFRLPYCFVLEQKGGKKFLITKITNGDGGYHTGVLISTTKFLFADTLYDKILKQLNTQNFWKLGRDTTCDGGCDGETWIFEAIENGRYNIIERWVPQDCGNSTTINLSKIGIELARFSNLDNILKAIDAHKSAWNN